jgi:hypothetical protein
MTGHPGVRTVTSMCRHATAAWAPPAQVTADPTTRVGDAERERTSTELRAQYTAGRLNVDEFSARLDEVWAATTVGDLQHAMRDLPLLRPIPAPPPGWRRGRRRPRFLAIAVVFALLWLVTAPGRPIWPLAVLAVLVLLHPWRLMRREATPR